MAIQFGLGIMRQAGEILGHLQNFSLDFSFDVAKLYSGAGLFPKDIRTHTGSIAGSAEFANLTAKGIERLTGGTRTGTSVAISNTSYPSTWELEFTMTTDSVTFTITLNECRATNLRFPFARDSHVIPNFDFEATADDANSVGTIELGDES